MAKPEDVPSLETLGGDIRKLRGKAVRKPKAAPEGTALAMRLGVELASGVFVGVVSGYYLDKWLNTSPFLFILCFLLGTAGGFLTVFRTLKSIEDKEDQG